MALVTSSPGRPPEAWASPVAQQMQQVTSALSYLEEKGVRRMLKELTESLLVDRPEDPTTYMAAAFQKLKPLPAKADVGKLTGPSLRGDGTGMGNAAEVACTFLADMAGDRQSHQEVQRLLELACTAVSGCAQFYSAPDGRGRQINFLNGLRDSQRPEGFVLVAESTAGKAPAVQRAGLAAPLDAAEVLQAAVDQGGAVSGLLAAAPVHTSAGLEGVLLVRAPSQADLAGLDVATLPALATASASYGGLALMQAVRLWSFSLAERLEMLRWRTMANNRGQALNKTLQVLDPMAKDGKDAKSVADLIGAASGMVPKGLIRGGIGLDSIALWYYDLQTDELCLNTSGEMDGIRISGSDSLVGQVLSRQGEIICVEDVYSHPLYDSTWDQKTGNRSQSTICVPLPAAGECGPTVVQFTNVQNQSGESRPITHWDFVAAEAMPLTVLPCVLQLRSTLMQILQTRRQTEGLHTLVAECSDAATVKDVIPVVKQALPELLDCQVCSLYFYDQELHELWAPPDSSHPDGVRFDIGCGVVGYVAEIAMEDNQMTMARRRSKFASDCFEEGEEDMEEPAVAISSVLTFNDPSTCEQWAGDDEGVSTRNFMVAPIFSVTTNSKELMGVVMVSNKTYSLSNKTEEKGFSLGDTSFFEVVVHALGSQLQRLLLDLMWTKATMDDRSGDPEASGKGDPSAQGSSMVQEYYVEGKTQTVKTITQGTDLRSAQAECGLALRTRKKRNTTLHDGRCDLAAVRKEASIREWSIDYWSLTEDDQYGFLVQAMRISGIDTEFRISPTTLSNFFEAVKQSYRNNPYHDFNHAISTLHYSFKFMMDGGLRDHLSRPDVLALLIGSLCHDCDHRGYNSAFEMVTRSELAIRYNDKSPLESHHCATLFAIAFDANAVCNIFESLEYNVYSWVRQQIVAGILGTDMKFHGDHVKLMQNFHIAPGIQGDQSQFLVESLIHVADIGNPMQINVNAVRWGEALAEEFSLQADKELELGLPVTPFMQGLRDPVGRAKSQIGFVDFVLMPLVTPMFRMFKGLGNPEDCLEENRLANNNVLSGYEGTTRRDSRKLQLEAKTKGLKGRSGRKLRQVVRTMSAERSNDKWLSVTSAVVNPEQKPPELPVEADDSQTHDEATNVSRSRSETR